MAMYTCNGFTIPESKFLQHYSQVKVKDRSLAKVHEIIMRYGTRVASPTKA